MAVSLCFSRLALFAELKSLPSFSVSGHRKILPFSFLFAILEDLRLYLLLSRSVAAEIRSFSPACCMVFAAKNVGFMFPSFNANILFQGFVCGKEF
jgi:hypothetical protein